MADTKEIKPFVQLSVQGATKTTELTDFPDDLTGQGGKVPRVKEDGTGFELALPAESHDMASPVGATYLVSDFRKLVAGEGYRLPLNSGTDYVNLTSVGLTNRPDAKSAFIEKISEHLYQLVINENTSNGELHDVYYLTLGDVLDDSLGLGNTGTTFNKDKTVFDLTTKLNSLDALTQKSRTFGSNGIITYTKKGNVIILGFDTKSNTNISVNVEIDISPPVGFEFLTDTKSTCVMLKNGGTGTSGIKIISKTKGTVVGGTLESSMTGSIVLFAE